MASLASLASVAVCCGVWRCVASVRSVAECLADASVFSTESTYHYLTTGWCNITA